MGNRAERRRAISDWRRAAWDELVTWMIPADAEVSDYPQLHTARARWTADIPQRRPVCLACRKPFAGGAAVGAHLLATAPGSGLTSVSGICESCFDSLPDDQLKAVCLRLLRRLLPTARWSE